VSERVGDFAWMIACCALVVGCFAGLARIERQRARQRASERDQEKLRKQSAPLYYVTSDDAGRATGQFPIRTAELRPAWSWDCDVCGKENFTRAVTPCSLEGLLPDGLDPEDFEGGEWITKPSVVGCEHCGLRSVVEEEEE
jgi:hypothetical protein